MPKQGRVSSGDKELDEDVNKLLNIGEQRERFGQGMQPKPRRAGLSQAETKREIAKQKVKNAELQRRRGMTPAKNQQRGK